MWVRSLGREDSPGGGHGNPPALLRKMHHKALGEQRQTRGPSWGWGELLGGIPTCAELSTGVGTRLVEESGRAFQAEEGLQAGNAMRAWETKAVDFKVQGDGRGGGGEGRAEVSLGARQGRWIFFLCVLCASRQEPWVFLWFFCRWSLSCARRRNSVNKFRSFYFSEIPV